MWTPTDGIETTHEKRYLPKEAGFWEASWYDSGRRDFSLVECTGALTGFLICTDLWATEARTLEKWRAGGQATSIVSGSFVASSNRVTLDEFQFRNGFSSISTSVLYRPRVIY
jgi:predicted amidohydrolase